MTWVVGHLCPPGTDVVGFASFEEACSAIAKHPPDAAVVSMTHAHLPWRDFQQLCASRTPAVPVLYESAIFSRAEEADLEPGEDYFEFLRKPVPRTDLEAALGRLLTAASKGASQLAL